MEIIIRDGGPGDLPAILGMFDSGVEWLVSQGRTRQWGTEPLSQHEKTVEALVRAMDEGATYLAEADGVPAACLVLTDGPGPHLSHLPPPGEPERYVRWLASDRRFKGRGTGGALLAHVAEVTRRAGVGLLRVDCYAGDDRALVAYYQAHGFTPTDSYTHGPDAWPGQVLARRVD
ncbi:GNAT family N-acetyltransferase [Streptomyces sp. NPDC017405]|uniref:GNAT family N-acetyltransferase n=1 Tax=unclassified Streptomyces TaxID=2593676 RepID=UPI003796C777